MSGAIPPLPSTPSWRGSQLKHRDNFTFAFVLAYIHKQTFINVYKHTHTHTHTRTHTMCMFQTKL